MGGDEDAAPLDCKASQPTIGAKQHSSKQRASFFWMPIDSPPHLPTGMKAEWMDQADQGNPSIRGRQIGFPPGALLARKARVLSNIGKLGAVRLEEGEVLFGTRCTNSRTNGGSR
jgi:hypothetical protein